MDCGGPRAGRGAPTGAGKVALLQQGWVWETASCAGRDSDTTGGGAVAGRQSEQCRVSDADVTTLPSASTMTVLAPSCEQTTTIVVGAISGDATAMPNVSTNHVKTRRVNISDVRRVCMVVNCRSMAHACQTCAREFAHAVFITTKPGP